MEHGDKELLLKDLCARLPYKVKCEVVKRDIDGEMIFIKNYSHAVELTVDNVKGLVTNDMYEIKPYLFPLSSMTEEQRLEYYGTFSLSGDISGSVDFYNKNHLDWRGLIPIGLAKDATRLNIY